jgi:signal transduction histidine kinase
MRSIFAYQDLGLAMIAGLVCLLAAYTAFSLAVKPAPAEKMRYPWLIAAGVSVGCGAWTAYLILLFGYQPHIPFGFDLVPTVIALVIGTVGSCGGLFVGRRTDLMPLGGAIMGFSIAAMFFVGMSGVQYSALKQWDLLSVAISIVLGASFGAAALARGHLTPDIRGRLLSTVLLSTGIMSTILVGLSAVELTPDSSIPASTGTVIPVLFGISLTAMVMLIVSLGLVGTLADGYVGEIESNRDALRVNAAELTAALKTAEASNETKARFLANMSHELRTPLNAVVGFSDILRKESFGPLGHERYQEYATDISDAGAHLLHLVNDVLELSKADAGQLKLQDEIVDLSGAISTCTRQVKRLAQNKDVQLSVELDANLPRLRIDAHRLQQILLNLLSNAVKFTPAGGKVSVSAYVCAGGLAIAIADTGIGMRPEEIEEALKHFGQIDNKLTRQHEGAGLGLPLAKSLVESHGGTLEITSEPDAGTRVSVVFPPERMSYVHSEIERSVA